MHGRWREAATVNRSIVTEFPDDVEAYNRLGKALSELGRNRDARAAFQSVLEMSPSNAIAKKNLSRLMKLSDQETPRVAKRASPRAHTFIEDSGKAGVTALNKLASSDVRLNLTPGDLVQLDFTGTGLSVTDGSGTYIGQVEPKVGSRIARLIRGGNRYEATITSAEEHEVAVIIRETYKSPAQSGTISFPLRGGADIRVYVPGSVTGPEVGDDDGELAVAETVAVKDWSNDDTEPGDDEAFSPVIHRIIISPRDGMSDGAEDF
jgi:hypothetical protein